MKCNRICPYNTLEGCVVMDRKGVCPLSIEELLGMSEQLVRTNDNLADKYLLELQTAKTEVAREIFEDIENIVEDYELGKFGIYTLLHNIAELKKKYTEGDDPK